MRTCLFCGPTDLKMTREHVMAQWVSRLIQPGAAVPQQIRHEKYRWGRLERRWSHRVMDATTKAVCKACNEGWLGHLEMRAKPIVGPLIVGQNATLTPQSQVAFASWAFKVAITSEFCDGDRDDPMFFTDDERHAFKAEQRPPRISVWAARCQSERAAFTKSAIRAIVDFRDQRKYRLIAITLTVGQLVAQVVAVRDDTGALLWPSELDKFEPRSHWPEHVLPVWPSTESSLRFPATGTLSDDDIVAFMDRWNGDG